MDQPPGDMEAGVLYDLSKLPAEMRQGGIAQAALFAARKLDNDQGELQDRDAAAYLDKIRHCTVQLRDWAPGEVQDDPTDEKRKSREGRMLSIVREQ